MLRTPAPLIGALGFIMNHCDIVTVLSALLTPTIAIGGVYIARQQWKLNEQKLSLDLYDRRLRIYHEVRKLISTVVRDGAIKLDELLLFYSSVSEVSFLFKDEVPKYIDEIYEHGTNLGRLKDELSARDCPLGEDVRRQHAAGIRREVEWFLKQLTESKDIFRSYLNLTK